MNQAPFALSLSFDKLRTIGEPARAHLPFALSLSFDKLRMIGKLARASSPFALSLSKGPNGIGGAP